MLWSLKVSENFFPHKFYREKVFEVLQRSQHQRSETGPLARDCFSRHNMSKENNVNGWNGFCEHQLLEILWFSTITSHWKPHSLFGRCKWKFTRSTVKSEDKLAIPSSTNSTSWFSLESFAFFRNASQRTALLPRLWSCLCLLQSSWPSSLYFFGHM